jgi:hypothetical protein
MYRLIAAISRVVIKRGGSQPKVSAFPWWLMALISPFVSTIRELSEMRYLWNVPHTPLDEAVLVGLGCLVIPSPVRQSVTVALS